MNQTLNNLKSTKTAHAASHRLQVLSVAQSQTCSQLTSFPYQIHTGAANKKESQTVEIVDNWKFADASHAFY